MNEKLTKIKSSVIKTEMALPTRPKEIVNGYIVARLNNPAKTVMHVKYFLKPNTNIDWTPRILQIDEIKGIKHKTFNKTTTSWVTSFAKTKSSTGQ